MKKKILDQIEQYIVDCENDYKNGIIDYDAWYNRRVVLEAVQTWIQNDIPDDNDLPDEPKAQAGETNAHLNELNAHVEHQDFVIKDLKNQVRRLEHTIAVLVQNFVVGGN